MPSVSPGATRGLCLARCRAGARHRGGVGGAGCGREHFGVEFLALAPVDLQPVGLLRGVALQRETVMNIAAGETPHISWQFLSYIIMTAAEILISITCLEFAYTQAPKTMKSIVMGCFFASVTLGNLFTAGVNYFIQRDDGTVTLEGADYYWFFTIVIAITAVLFLFVLKFYVPKTFVQDEMELELPDSSVQE